MGFFKARLLAGAIVVLVLAVPASAQAVVLTVDSNADNSTNDGLCTLREATTAVNTNADVNGPDDCDHDGGTGTDTISLANVTYTITTGSGYGYNLATGGDVIIDGFTQGGTVVDANDQDAVFSFSGSGVGNLQDLTATDGTALGGGVLKGSGGASVALSNVTISQGTGLSSPTSPSGGGIYFEGAGSLNVLDSTVTGNTIGTGGGQNDTTGGAGIVIDTGNSHVVVSRSTVSGNTINQANDADDNNVVGGGGIKVNGGGNDLSVIDSTISGNTVTSTDPQDDLRGGGLQVLNAADDVTIRRSAITGNTINGSPSVAYGGGVSWTDGTGTDDTLTIENSTLSGNSGTGSGSAEQGGGVSAFDGKVALVHSTIAGNVADDGRAIHYQGTAAGADDSSFSARGSIVSEQSNACLDTGDDIQSQNYNVDAGNTCHFTMAQDAQIASPNMVALADNGGPTQTHSIGSVSAALDRVPAAACLDAGGSPLTSDQRGATRPDPQGGTHCDSGAYERDTCSGVLVNVVGTGGPDNLDGTGGADGVLALGGGDNIQDFGGSDAICAGDGNDTIVEFPDNVADQFLGEVGSDTVDFSPPFAADRSAVLSTGAGGSASGGSFGNDTMNSVENAIGGQGNETFTAANENAANNLTGGSGDDTLEGRGGNDTLTGGPNDAAGDTVLFNHNPGPVTVNLNTTVAQNTGDGNDTITGAENVTGSPFPDNLTGTPGANTISGLSSPDMLVLGAGPDNVIALDGITDTIDCTGGGPDTGIVDTTPAESYVNCDSDGDGLVDFFDSCPLTRTQANGCPDPPVSAPPTTLPTTTATTSKKCKKKKRRRSAVAARKKCKKRR